MISNAANDRTPKGVQIKRGISHFKSSFTIIYLGVGRAFGDYTRGLKVHLQYSGQKIGGPEGTFAGRWVG